MWKRLQHHKADRQLGVLTEASRAENRMEAPVYGQNDYDGARMEVVHKTSPRPSTDVPKELPLLPFQPASDLSLSSPTKKEIKRRPVSPLYSQSSPRTYVSRSRHVSRAAEAAYLEQIEISPPSSPDAVTPQNTLSKLYQDTSVSPDASPVEYGRPKFDTVRKPSTTKVASSIPILGGNRWRNPSEFMTADSTDTRDASSQHSSLKSRGRDTRWDVYTGEPTLKNDGRPPQISPANLAANASTSPDFSSQGPFGSTTTVTADNPKVQPSFGERIRKLRERNLRTEDYNRMPVRSRENLPSLEIPRKSSKRAQSRGTDSSKSTPLSTMLSSQNLTSTEDAMSGISGLPQNIQPPRVSGNVKQTSLPYVSSSKYRPDLDTTTDVTDGLDIINSMPNPSQQNLNARSTSPTTSNLWASKAMRAQTDATALQNEMKLRATTRDQLPSRFAVPAIYDERKQRADEDATSTRNQQFSSVLQRSRPRNGSIDSTRTITRKAVGSNSTSKSVSSPSSTMRSPKPITHKSLPKSPAEAASVDRISGLQARIDDLTRRRDNLQESIRQMTELMPRVGERGAETRRREEEKRKVEILKDELADVSKEQHELGLKLHRAYKRQEREAAYEPNSLWVRRVTG